MKYLGITLLALIFAAAPIGVMAQTTCCPQVCPTPCPQTCPAPCPQTCPAPCPCPCEAPCLTCPAQPADIGAGPAPCLENLCGCDFDVAFMQQMYQQHSDITALATQGIQLSTDKDIRDLSGKIRYEQTKQSQKLVYWAQKQGFCNLTADYNRIQGVMDNLKQCCGADYNIPYVQTMIGLLEQNRCAAQMAMSRATQPGLRDQAKIVVNSTSKEIAAFQSWLSKYNAYCPGTCPAPYGAGPIPCPTVCPAPQPCPSTCPTPSAPCPVQCK
jgi:uncharacterized protein (DUF305 family)